MTTVVSFARALKQPRGGYLKKCMSYQFEDNEFIDGKEEKLQATTVGTTVDYLARFLFFSNKSIKQLLEPVVLGALIIEKNAKDNIGIDVLKKLNNTERKLTPNVIDLMIKASFITDVYRSGRPDGYINAKEYQHADDEDYKHIERLTKRCLNFLEILKEKSKEMEADFAVASDKDKKLWGDGDIITDNTIADFKVYSRNPWNKDNSLQLATYYLLGKNGIELSNTGINFSGIKYLTLFDVRNNRINYVNVDDFKNELSEIQKEIDMQ